jgi:hypothetical protein
MLPGSESDPTALEGALPTLLLQQTADGVDALLPALRA